MDFFSIWALLKPQGEYKRRYQACARLWSGYAPEMQERIFISIRKAKEQGERVHPNPYFAIEDTTLLLQRPRRKLQQSDLRETGIECRANKRR